MKLKANEHDIQTACLNLLAMKNFYAIRLNSGKIRTDRGHLVNLSAPGTPDIMAYKKSSKLKNAPANAAGVCLLFFEVKSEKGKVTFLQEAKMRELTEYGAQTYVVRSVDDVERIIKSL